MKRKKSGPRSEFSKIETEFVKKYSEEELGLLKSQDTPDLKSLVAQQTAYIMKAKLRWRLLRNTGKQWKSSRPSVKALTKCALMLKQRRWLLLKSFILEEL